MSVVTSNEENLTSSNLQTHQSTSTTTEKDGIIWHGGRYDIDGKTMYQPRIAYCCQRPWIVATTVKANITMGGDIDYHKINNVNVNNVSNKNKTINDDNNSANANAANETPTNHVEMKQVNKPINNNPITDNNNKNNNNNNKINKKIKI